MSFSCQAIIKVQENVFDLGVLRMNSSYEISISKKNVVVVFVIWENYKKKKLGTYFYFGTLWINTMKLALARQISSVIFKVFKI